MKKLILLFTVIFTLSFLLSACGETAGTSEPESQVEVGAEYSLNDISSCLILYAFPRDAQTGMPIFDVTAADITEDNMGEFACALVFYSTGYYTSEDKTRVPADGDFANILILNANAQKVVYNVFGVQDYVGTAYDNENGGYIYATENAYTNLMIVPYYTTENEDGTLSVTIVVYDTVNGEMVAVGGIILNYEIVIEGDESFARFINSVDAHMDFAIISEGNTPTGTDESFEEAAGAEESTTD